ncbi:MAG: hypothetical protein OEL69_02670 [Nitrosopumilus sp.]|jgi:DNA-directed RNA polymerase subunit M/transcription elongation factor TFIIS|nr:hypothetical protein [Nitrosopumilus sp.]
MSLTQIVHEFNQTIEITHESSCKSMIDRCQKCSNDDVEVFQTEVFLNDEGITIIPLCDKCRRFWFSE